MPRRTKKSRKGGRKKRVVRRRKAFAPRRKQTTWVTRSIGQADRAFAKLVYSDAFAYTIALGSPALQVFRGNSLNDPDYTGVGHQPRAYDQFTALYDKYRVLGSSITARIAYGSSASAGAINLIACVIPSSSPTSLAAENALITENRYAKTRYLNAYQGMDKPLKHYMTTAKMFGTPSVAVRAEDNYAAVVGNNPSTVWYWHVYVSTLDFATNSSATVYLTLNYYVEFFKPLNEGSG